MQSAFAQCEDTGEQVERNTYNSTILGSRMFYSVYLPPCYDMSDQKYPVIYLMHGSNEDDGQWLRLGLQEALDHKIRSGELPPVIVALPFGDLIANRNRFDSVSWGNIFLNEFMPTVEWRYRVDAQPAMRAIGGISRGGFWAFHIAFKNPDLFSAVGGHSAFFDLYHAPPEDNPLDLALSANDLEPLRIWLDRGEQDFSDTGLDIMDQRLRERGLRYQYTVHPQGEHNNAYWSQHVAEYLDFYAATWHTDQNEKPPRASSSGIMLFVPAVGFPSLQTTMSREALLAVSEEGYDPQLVIDSDTAAQLREFGVILAPDTRIVEPGALFGILWRDRAAYTLLPFDRLTPRYRVLHVDEVHPLDNDLAEYPFAFASDSANFHPDRLTRLTLSGVTALTRRTRAALDEHGASWAGEAILPYVSRADFFHTSNEVSIYPTCPETSAETLGGSTSFCSKPEHFELLTDLDLDIVELTGNHNNDYGFDAYRDTLKFYHENGIMTVGGGASLAEARQPLILEHNGNSIVMVACNWIGPYYALANDDKDQPGAAYCDWGWLSDALPSLAQASDLLIVTVQYQEAEQYTPTDQQIHDFRALARLGADVIIGTQAHKPQTIEFFDTGQGEAFIHYGLGNLFFDQEFWGNMRFFMDQLFIYEGRLLTIDLFTGIIEDRGRPRPMTPDERQNFMFFMMVEQGGF